MKRPSARAAALSVGLGAFVVTDTLVASLVALALQGQGVVAPVALFTHLHLATAVALLAHGLMAFLRLRPLVRAPLGAAPRRVAAHDYPLHNAGALLALGALLSSVAFVSMREHGVSETDALVIAVMTCLGAIVAVLPTHLALRRILQVEAAGVSGQSAIDGRRQPVRIRLALATTLPLTVCTAALFVVEQSNARAYARDVTALYETQRADVRDRLARIVAPHSTSDAASQLRATVAPGPSNIAQTLPPLTLLACLVGLAVALGFWLSRELAMELGAVRDALVRVRSSAAPEWEAPRVQMAFRETHALLRTYALALQSFLKRRDALDAAASARRRADVAKARFLAHLSHELKSPLNTILGFSEVLLAGLDGPLTPRQRAHLGLMWRAGDSLLRFIQALLDAARVEERPDAPPTASSSAVPASLVLRELELAWRRDPLGAVTLVVDATPAALSGEVNADPTRTARGVALTAGLLADSVDAGVVRVRFDHVEATLTATIALEPQSGDDAAAHHTDRLKLRAQLAQAATHAPDSAAGTTLMVLGALVAQDCGRLRRLDALDAEDVWPCFELTWPAPGPT